jgi:hypothetical protein
MHAFNPERPALRANPHWTIRSEDAMHTLTEAERKHTQQLMTEIDRLPALGDSLDGAPLEEIETRLRELNEFLTGVLMPHIEAQESTLYPQMERLLQNRHSMTPMCREHTSIRELVGRFGTFRLRSHGIVNASEALELKRLIFPLYALLKVHLAEEERYAAILEHNLPEDRAAELARALEHSGFPAV